MGQKIQSVEPSIAGTIPFVTAGKAAESIYAYISNEAEGDGADKSGLIID